MGHSGSYTTWAEGPMTIMSSQALRINPGDAAGMAVADGDEVTVSSPQGSIAVKAVLE